MMKPLVINHTRTGVKPGYSSHIHFTQIIFTTFDDNTGVRFRVGFESVIMKKVKFIAEFVQHFSCLLMRNVNIKLTNPNLPTTQVFYEIKSYESQNGFIVENLVNLTAVWILGFMEL